MSQIDPLSARFAGDTVLLASLQPDAENVSELRRLLIADGIHVESISSVEALLAGQQERLPELLIVGSLAPGADPILRVSINWATQTCLPVLVIADDVPRDTVLRASAVVSHSCAAGEIASRARDFLLASRERRGYDCHTREAMHEINNPLSAVVSLSQLLVDDLRDNEQALKCALTIRNASLAISQTSRSLQVQASMGQRVVVSHLDLGVRVRRAVSEVERLFPFSTHKISVLGEFPRVRGLETWLDEVLRVILSGILKSARGSIAIEIRSEAEEAEPTAWILILVREGELDVERFREIMRPSGNLQFGSGEARYGLPLVRSLVWRMGGEFRHEIAAESAEFRLSLPLL